MICGDGNYVDSVFWLSSFGSGERVSGGTCQLVGIKKKYIIYHPVVRYVYMLYSRYNRARPVAGDKLHHQRG